MRALNRFHGLTFVLIQALNHILAYRQFGRLKLTGPRLPIRWHMANNHACTLLEEGNGLPITRSKTTISRSKTPQSCLIISLALTLTHVVGI